MNALRSPRLWLLVWLAAGAAFLAYIIVAASVQPRSAAAPTALKHDRALLTGEMADFEYAYLPRKAPVIPFQHDGVEMSLADFRGRAVLVNFWATWCAPCLKELPSLDALERELGGDNFSVVAIAADPRGPEVAAEYLARLNIKNLKHYADPRLLFTTAIGGADVLPLSILYDSSGNEVGRLPGEADWQSPEAIRLVSSIIR